MAEFEESVRATNWIFEEEMIKLRILRAIFYGAITVGELDPLLKYVRSSGINVVDVFRTLIEMKDSYPVAGESIDWLSSKAREGWFDTQEEAIDYFADEKNVKALLETPMGKLNYDLLSYVMLAKERYDAFHELMRSVVTVYFPSPNNAIVTELIGLGKSRNYIVSCLRGTAACCVSVSLSAETIEQLGKMKYLDIPNEGIPSNTLSLEIDESIAESISSSLQDSESQLQTIAILAQKFPIYLRPADRSQNSDIQT